MHHTRVEPSTHEPMQQLTFVPHPVKFGDRDGEWHKEREKPSKLIVTLSNDAIVTPKSILKPPKYVVESENS